VKTINRAAIVEDQPLRTQRGCEISFSAIVAAGHLKKLTIVMLNPPQAGFSIYPFAEWTQNPTFIRLRQISQVSG